MSTIISYIFTYRYDRVVDPFALFPKGWNSIHFVPFVAFVVMGLEISQAPDLAPKGGVIIEPRPSGLGPESKRNLPLCRRPSRSAAERHRKIGCSAKRGATWKDRLQIIDVFPAWRILLVPLAVRDYRHQLLSK
jgi:hypothetical protein